MTERERERECDSHARQLMLEPSQRADPEQFLRDEAALMARAHVDVEVMELRMYVHCVCMWSVVRNRIM